jgi:hypothetical protein
MKTMNVILGAVFALFVSFAADAGKVKIYENTDLAIEQDRTVSRTLRAYNRDNWVEMSRELTTVNYFAAPTTDYKYGEMTITMRLSDSCGDYCLTTYYDYVHVVLYSDVETGGIFVNNIYVESQVVY